MFWSEDLKGRGNFGDLDIDGRVMLKLSLKLYEFVDWVNLAQDRDQ
jgi:hypothetical protein